MRKTAVRQSNLELGKPSQTKYILITLNAVSYIWEQGMQAILTECGGTYIWKAMIEKDFGVIVDKQLSVSSHCDAVAKRANATLGSTPMCRREEVTLPLHVSSIDETNTRIVCIVLVSMS